MQEPSHKPDMSAMDSPEDQIRELAASFGFDSEQQNNLLTVIRMAGENGLLHDDDADDRVKDALRKLIRLVGDASNAGLTCWCVDYAFGLDIFGGMSETQIGLKWGRNRATVSLIIRQVREQFGVASRGCRTQHAADAYRARARAAHASGKMKRKPVMPWRGAQFFKLKTTNP